MQDAGFIVMAAFIVGGVVLIVQAAANVALVYLHIHRPRGTPAATAKTGTSSEPVKVQQFSGLHGIATPPKDKAR